MVSTTESPIIEPKLSDRRRSQRHPFQGWIALLADRDADTAAPMVLRCRDLSFGGLKVVCRRHLFYGDQGIVQLVRSSGQAALVGVSVAHIAYRGDLHHEMGLAFTHEVNPITIERFLDAEGRVRLTHPLLTAPTD